MGVRQRLYPTEDQQATLLEFCAHERFLINLSIEQFNFAARYRPRGGRSNWPTAKTRGRELTELRSELPWLAAGSLKAQQQALRIIDQAFRNWWSNPAHFRRPTFRSRHHTQGFRLVGAGQDYRIEKINRKWARIKVPKVATPIRFRLTVAWSRIADTRSCRITCDRSGRWHISFPGPQPEIERTPTGSIVGVDRGVANTVATSDGEVLHMPGLTAAEQRRWRKLEHELARRQKGSNRREHSRRQLARMRQRLNDRRSDWIEKATTDLVEKHDVIVLEQLHVRSMTKSARGTTATPGRNVAAKSGLNRAILAQRWGEFATRLEQKAETCGVVVTYFPARHTSTTCRHCGHIAASNRESQAVFRCVSCGYSANADTNAAETIRDRWVTTNRRGTRGDRTQRPRVAGSVKRQPPQLVT